MTSQDAERMRREADEADKRYKEGTNRPMEGLPVCVKDNIDTLDEPTTAGSPALKGNLSKVEPQVWLRLRNQGAINCGKTNMNEFALGATTYNKYYGNAKNAFDTERTSGGSSGGTGGLIGTGAVALGLGTDHSGSCRVPASFNGVVGYRPTVNRWPCEFGIKASHFKDTAGPLALDMDDLVLLDEAVTETLHHDLPALGAITVAVPRLHFYEDLDHEIEKHMTEVVQKLKSAGVRVIENDGVEITYDQAMTSFHVANFEFRARLQDYLIQHGLQDKLNLDKVIELIASEDVKQLLQEV